jgi:hypothetical protein
MASQALQFLWLLTQNACRYQLLYADSLQPLRLPISVPAARSDAMKSAFQELIDEKQRLRPKNTRKNYDPKRKLWQVCACYWLCRHVFGSFV